MKSLMKLWPLGYEISEFRNFVEKIDEDPRKMKDFFFSGFLLLLSILFIKFSMILIMIGQKCPWILVEFMFKMTKCP